MFCCCSMSLYHIKSVCHKKGTKRDAKNAKEYTRTAKGTLPFGRD